jgi:hypothetical protein
MPHCHVCQRRLYIPGTSYAGKPHCQPCKRISLWLDRLQIHATRAVYPLLPQVVTGEQLYEALQSARELVDQERRRE